MRLCFARASHFHRAKFILNRAKFIPKRPINRRSIVFTDSAMMLICSKRKWGV
jgi:hypothetical protein